MPTSPSWPVSHGAGLCGSGTSGSSAGSCCFPGRGTDWVPASVPWVRSPWAATISWRAFLGKLAKRKARIKSLLLDQKVVAGVGNIYADEALFEAGVHPARRVRYLRRWEKVRLFETIPQVLERAVLHGGTTLRDYRRSSGMPGTYQTWLKVYGRDGQPCTQCDSIIQKTVISQRGSHFCPYCQPRKPRPRPFA